GAFALEKVEQAVWDTPVGEVTPVVQQGDPPDAFYLAKVEERKPGRVVPFEEEGVQARIEKQLSDEQFLALQEKVQAELERDAVVKRDPQMRESAVEMAMQNYRTWRGG